jgi:hypothetical protein
VTRPAPPPSPLRPGPSREQVQAHADRGRQSREAARPPARPAPVHSAPARPAPAVQRHAPAAVHHR